MSQAKVDKYKQEKANRKKIMAQEKAKAAISKLIAGVICAGIVAWAGYSAYGIYESKQPAKTYYCDTTAIDDYMDEVSY